MKIKKVIQRKEKAGEKATAEKREVEMLEAEQKRIRKYLSETEIAFCCYASRVDDNGQLVGLSDEAQMRQYIEGNALNSRASQEEMVKYEQFSPVVMLLREVRELHEWMRPEFIEEDTKTVSSSSPKLFTLSALLQAFSLSALGHNKPLKVDEDDIQRTDDHELFVREFWDRVRRVFGSTWIPDADQPHGERVSYLQELRGENHRSVVFQAIFLLALGRLGYQMGMQTGWDPDHAVLEKVDLLSPNNVNYFATTPGEEWNQRWVNSMMKQSINMKTGEVEGYVFNNTRENVEATFRELARLANFVIDEDATESIEPESKVIVE